MQINSKLSAHVLELLAGKNAFQDIAQRWPPGGKTVHYKVAKALPIRVVYQGRSSFAQPQKNDVDSRLGHKILAPETIYNLYLKPRLHQHWLQRFARLAKTNLPCFLLHPKGHTI